MTAYLSRYRVSLVRDGNVALPTRRCTEPHVTASILRECMPRDSDREHFAALYLNVRHTAVAFHEISVGCMTSSLVHPREVFKPAILCQAAAVVVCHNHPSGDASPSQEDIFLTKRLAAAGLLLGIDLVDHIILGDGTSDWTSMHQRGLMS